MADIEKYAKTKLFQVNADERSYGSSTSDFVFDLGSSNGITNAKRIVLKSVIFANVFYNIQTTNNTLVIKKNATTDFTITIPEGFYSADELAVALQAAIRTAFGTNTVSVSIDSIVGKFKFTIVAPDTQLTIFYDDLHPTSTLAKVIGVAQTQGFVVVPADGAKFVQYMPQLAGLTSVNLQSSALAGGNFLEENSTVKPVIMSIPITAPFLAINVYESLDDELNSINYQHPVNIQKIDLQLTDRNGKIVDLQTSNLKALFKVYY